MIKAIETEYKGYRFRSRTEARWAVFFDALGIEWEYEKEGYDLGAAWWYLPDFWLPSLQCWVEIKGADPTDTERAKAKVLCELSQKDVVMFSGVPWFNIVRAYYVYGPEYADDEDVIIGYSAQDWSYYDAEDAKDYDFERTDGEGRYYQGWMAWGFSDTDSYDPRLITLVERDDVRNARLMKYAYEAARSARFEHGESGAAR